MEVGGRTMPEAILVEIIARLPLRIIARFKSVCKQWKSVIESLYFRRFFISLHKKSSSSWSLMFRSDYTHPITEAISFHGCQTSDLPKSLGSYIIPSFQRYPNLPTSRYFYVASSNGLIWINVFVTRTDNMAYSYKSFVGNPVLQQWVEIPPPPDQCTATGLVTRVDENGAVSGFKVVRTCDTWRRTEPRDMGGMYVWRVFVYSSETGTWTFKRLLSSHPVNYTGSYPPVNHNGMLYLREKGSDPNEPTGVLVAHDFYGPEDDNRCLVIPLPLMSSENVRRCLTTSGEDVFYVEILCPRLKVWRLNNNYSVSSEWWHLSREQEINLASVLDCFPMAVNPFDADIVYLWSQQHECLVSGNLRTQEFTVHRQESENWGDSEGCWRINTSDSKGYVEYNCNVTTVFILSPFVLQRWMDSVPCPSN
ncbi:hypothetical protein EUTSA_v10011517mg [Eutrema salsugineum]|uniref:F-box domain-containing protein n=1 Tax=Eutrema salsugineum TaxID=72664 RepID=V4JYB9_EUTSA|nr:F-box protein At1g49990 [Eutrema salsugineum]ESQ30480.1 hypothetical protein EUTSA_v10011517mg [Eutrema salsugineum]